MASSDQGRAGYTMREVMRSRQPAFFNGHRPFLLKGASLPPRLRATSRFRSMHPLRSRTRRELQGAQSGPASGAGDRSALSKDELMAEFFLKPTSAIIGPGGTVIIPRDLEARRLRGRALRGDRQESAQPHGSAGARRVFGYTICWDISQRDPWGASRPPEHAQHPQGLRHLRRARPVDRHRGRAARATGHAHPRRAERQARHDRAHQAT